LKKYDTLSTEEKTLYRSYKNRVVNLVEYARDPARAEWSFPFEIFHNLTPQSFASNELYGFYRALFDVTSYYQHNTAGIAKFGNEIISKLGPSDNLVTELHLAKLPSKIFGDASYSWIGTKDDDVTTDVVNMADNSLIFAEFKFRVDSGCTAGRREVWETKFLKIIQHLVTGKKIYSRGNSQYSLRDLLVHFGITSIELYIAILFDIKGELATVSEDRKFICYGGMEESYERVKNYLKENGIKFKEIKPSDPETEAFLLKFNIDGLSVKVGAKYANSAIDSLFKGRGADLSTIRQTIQALIYDDLWLSQLISLSERAILLPYQVNYLHIIERALEEKPHIKNKALQFKELRYENETQALEVLNEICKDISKIYSAKFRKLPTPVMVSLMQAFGQRYDITDYIGDIFQIVLAIS